MQFILIIVLASSILRQLSVTEPMPSSLRLDGSHDNGNSIGRSQPTAELTSSAGMRSCLQAEFDPRVRTGDLRHKVKIHPIRSASFRRAMSYIQRDDDAAVPNGCPSEFTATPLTIEYI